MQRLRELLAHGGIAILAVVFALAFAVFHVAQAVATQVVSTIQQHSFGDGGGGVFTFTIADTTINYGEILIFAITLALVGLALFAVWWLTRRTTRLCPECRSTVPAAASVCRFCTTDLSPPPADA